MFDAVWIVGADGGRGKPNSSLGQTDINRQYPPMQCGFGREHSGNIPANTAFYIDLPTKTHIKSSITLKRSAGSLKPGLSRP